MAIHRPKAYSLQVRWYVLIVLIACDGGSAQQCEIFSDCPSGQVCLMNVCTNLDAGSDGGDDGAIPANCGNGMLDPGEQCDQGASNADAPDACRMSCLFPRCGDGIVDTGEGCDDGNAAIFDGCTPRCRLESDECVVVHSANDRGSSFSSVALSTGTVQTLSTNHPHTDDVEHSLVRCAGSVFAATDAGIVVLGLREGVPTEGSLEPLDDVRELACSDTTLFAVDGMATLFRYSVADGSLSRTGELDIPVEMRNQTRVVPFVRGESLILVAVSARLGFSGPRVFRVALSDPSMIAQSFELGGSLRGPAVDISTDGSTLLGITPMGCAARWPLEADGAPDSSCELIGAPIGDTIVAADPSASRAWVGADNGATMLDTDSWETVESLSGFRGELLIRASSGFFAVGQDQLTPLVSPISPTLIATSGSVRGAAVVPCAP